MAGALAERVFVDKVTSVGFGDVDIHERRAFSLDDVESYPLFTPELLAVARELLTPEAQAELAVSVTLTAHKGA